MLFPRSPQHHSQEINTTFSAARPHALLQDTPRLAGEPVDSRKWYCCAGGWYRLSLSRLGLFLERAVLFLGVFVLRHSVPLTEAAL